MEQALRIIAGLLDMMGAAIVSGDWKVDGACDPDFIIDAAEGYLERHGWVKTTDGWSKEP